VEAERGKYPYAQVSLRDFFNDHQCGGSVVAPDVILSAGHCIGAVSSAVVGAYNFSDPSEIVEQFSFDEVRIHPLFEERSSYITYDVALIKLNGNITSTGPVRINDDERVPYFSDMLTVVGWGFTYEQGIFDFFAEAEDVMREVDVPFVGNTRCMQIQDDNFVTLTILDDMLCAGGNGKDSCQGDSGGPLILLGNGTTETVQVGVTSWGSGCVSIHPGVYHRTSYTFDWIRENMCNMSDVPPDYFLCNTAAPTTSPAPSQAPSAPPTVDSANQTRTVDSSGSIRDVPLIRLGIFLVASLAVQI